MRFSKSLALGFLVPLLQLQFTLAQPPNELSTSQAAMVFELDVIELVSGRETAGTADRHVDFEGIRYLFSTDDNHAAFERQPAKHSIQLAGSCGHMGSLGHQGLPEIWAIHEERVFIFASPECKEAFVKSPEIYLENDDAPPDFSKQSRTTGLQIFARVLRACGGEKALDAIRNYHQTYAEPIGKGLAAHGNRSMYVDFEHAHIIATERQSATNRVSVLAGDLSYFESDGKRLAMHSQAQRELQRHSQHLLVTLLKSRNRSDFQVGSLDAEGTVNKVSTLQVYFDGTLLNLRVNTATGEVMSLRYRARGPDGTYAATTAYLSNYQSPIGATAPACKLPSRVSFRHGQHTLPPVDMAIAVNQARDDSMLDLTGEPR